MKIATTILKDAANVFKAARVSVYEGARLLYRIQETNAWEGQFSSFAEYVEQECQISKGYASKLLQSYKYYVIDGGVLQQNLKDIDADKLYFAMKLPKGTVEQRLVKAREWNRQDLRDELSTDSNGEECPHEKTVTICATCGRRVN